MLQSFALFTITWEALPFEYQALVDIGLKLVRGALITVLGFLLVRISSYIIKKLIKPINIRNDSKLSEKRVETLQSVAISCVKYIIYFVVIYELASTFSNNTFQPLVAVAGAFGVAIGLGAQDLVKDVIAGFFILFEDQFSVGDIVEIKEKTGTIEEIGIRATKIRGFTGELFIIPNGSIQEVTNWAKEYANAVFIVKVPYEESIERVMDILADEMQASAGQVEGMMEPPKILGITDLGDYNIKIRITAFCKAGLNWSVERALRLRIKKRFEAEGVKPPYPAGLQNINVK